MPTFDIVKYTEDFFKLPGPALHKRWLGEYEAVSMHTQGKVAKRLIKQRRPYEDKEINEYRILNYEPITKGPFRRFKTNLSRVYSASQVTIEVGNEVVQKFIDGPNFYGMDIRSFWSRRLTGRMIDDPNGFLVWWVDLVPEAPNEKVRPIPYLVLSKNVVHYTPDVFTWLSNELSPVDAPDPAGGSERLEQLLGKVYYIVTPQFYYKFRQIGRIEDKTFEMVAHYTHGLGEMPVDILGGEEHTEANEKTNEDETWLTSFVSNAIPYANECARQWSDHQGVLIVSGYPIREMKPIKCTHKGCNAGWITTKVEGSDANEKLRCPSCKGRGKLSPIGPYGVLLREEQGVLTSGGAIDDRDMVKFLNPDPAILEFGGKTWRDYLNDTNRELDLVFVEEAQSGVAKDIDREPKVAKLDLIGYHLFMVLMKRSIRWNGKLLNEAVDEEKLNIALPATFVVRTEEDLNEELKNFLGPASIKAQIYLDFCRKRFAGNKSFIGQQEVLFLYDPLYGQTPSEVAGALMGGVVDTLMVRQHELAPNALARLVKTKGIKILEATDIFDQISDAIEEQMPGARVDEETKKDAELANAGKPPAKPPFGKK